MRRFTNRLRDLRQDKDLTQAEVAKIFYLQVTQYRRYENGESDLPLEWAKKSILNIANVGKFSSDRTIEEYVKDIWKLEKIKVED